MANDVTKGESYCAQVLVTAAAFLRPSNMRENGEQWKTRLSPSTCFRHPITTCGSLATSQRHLAQWGWYVDIWHREREAKMMR